MTKSNSLNAPLVKAALVGTLGLTLLGSAFAASTNREENGTEFKAATSATVSIADAVKAAEMETGGKAVKINIEDEKEGVAWEVETMKADGTEHEVKIDAMNGKILKVANASDASGDDENR